MLSSRRLQELEQVVAGHAAAALGLDVMLAELRLEHAVIPAHLLLLAQLKTVLRRTPGAALAVLARREVARGLPLA